MFFGRTRFDQFTDSLGISRAVLAQRLERLEAEGVVEARLYQDRPPRREYVLTDKGQALWEILAAMWRFGADWMFEADGPRIELVDKRTGGEVRPRVIDENTGRPMELTHTSVRSRA